MGRITKLFVVGVLFLSSWAQAKPGLFFNIAESSGGAAVDIILCLNGKGPLSCQNYHVTAQDLHITTTIAHFYPAAGIKVLSPGYQPSGCTFYPPTGYCLFSVSNAQEALIRFMAPAVQVSPTTLNFTEGGIAQTVTVSNTSTTTGVENLQVSIPGNSAITVDTANTTCTSNLAANSSCTYSFLPGNQVETNTLITISGSNTTAASTVTANVNAITLNLSASNLVVVLTSTGTVTVTNTSTTTAVDDLQVTIPSGSTISVDTGVSTCTLGGTLAASGTCTFVFEASAADTTVVTIQGGNSTPSQLTITAGTAPLLTVTGSSQSVNLDTSTAQNITISNAVGALPTSISATGPVTRAGSTWSGIVDIGVSNCQNLQAGDSCTLTLNTTSPNVPGQLTIIGSNGANTLTPWATTFMNGGYVFYVAGTPTLVKVAKLLTGDVWRQTGTFPSSTTDNNDGCTNTVSILANLGSAATAALTCTSTAPQCGTTDSGWYLSAICELGYGLEGGPGDCNSDNQYNDTAALFISGIYTSTSFYWSSSETVPNSDIWTQEFVFADSVLAQLVQGGTETVNSFPIICARAFNP